ncbi:MAG: ATP-binding protein, partial [Erysipelotrichaceae bacterium]|nr:ATP-binding protein [Erysipelotrichaceae bacterium]
MNKINMIQNAIKELEGGSFQKLFDAYLKRKFGFDNIHSLGVQEGTNKPTKGIPDSYVKIDDSYILIMYGSVARSAFNKLKDDILSCIDRSKLNLERNKIKKIITGYLSTNITIEQQEELKMLVPDITIDLIDIGQLSHDLYDKYKYIAKDFLNIDIDTNQILPISEFITKNDSLKTNAKLDMNFFYRENELEKLHNYISESNITIVSGNSGVGKTRLVLEAFRKYNDDWEVLCIRSNGQPLFNDLSYYFNQEGKYLLLIDDANEIIDLRAVMDYIYDLSDSYTVKIVMTIRKYAVNNVTSII